MVGGATTGAGDDDEEMVAAVAAGTAGGAATGAMEADASKRAIFRWGAAADDPKLPSSSMKRLGVLMMRSETVLTTGMMNCLMFFRVLRTPPASALPAAATAAPPFSSLFCAPFLARCSSCLAMVASVRLEDGTILTGFLWRGLFRRPAAAAAAATLDESEDAGGPKGSWPSACWRT